MRIPAKRVLTKKAYPAYYGQALAALRASSSKFKAAPEKDLMFAWSLGVRMHGAMSGAALGGAAAAKTPARMTQEALRTIKNSDPQGYCDGMMANGDFSLVLMCQERHGSDALGSHEPCPAEVIQRHMDHALVLAPKPIAAASVVLHVNQPSALQPGVHQYEITGGYIKDKKEIILMDSRGMLHAMDARAGIAHWDGMLRGTAGAAYEACAEGAIFRYRNKPMVRMAMSEVAAEVAKNLVWAFGGPGRAIGAAPLPPVVASAPVYPPRGEDGADRPSIGDVASLGLLTAASSASVKSKSKPKL